LTAAEEGREVEDVGGRESRARWHLEGRRTAGIPDHAVVDARQAAKHRVDLRCGVLAGVGVNVTVDILDAFREEMSGDQTGEGGRGRSEENEMEGGHQKSELYMAKEYDRKSQW